VLSVGDERIGLLELPHGGQILVRMGSVIDGGKVTELSAKRLRIAFPDRSVELALDGVAGGRMAQGSAHAAVAVASTADSGAPDRATATRGTRARPRAPDNVVPPAETRSVSAAAVRLLLVNGIPEAPHSDAGLFVAEQIGPMFDLPEHSRLLAVNDEPVTSAGQAVAGLQRALTNGVAVLGIDTPEGPRRVYVAPQRVPGR
jgi:hypothetical protein